MIYVIGSGPAGIACSAALLERGLRVHMLDGGIELEPSHQLVVDQLASTPPERWDPASVAILKQNVQATADGLPRKKAFGSDFPYQETKEAFPVQLKGAHLLASLARGGLSTVWGAAVLPHRAEDMKDWPISLKDLEPHYRAVLKLLPFSAKPDDLEALFPLYSEDAKPLQLSSQARSFLSHLTPHREALKKAGIYFGESRLATRAETEGHQQGCVYCGLCMYGCPYQCIYSSDHTLRELMKNPAFYYQKDVIVRRLEESGSEVKITTHNRYTRAQATYSGTQVFLAGGILSTTQIVSESLKAYNRPFQMGYSQHFMFPLWRSRSESGVTRERLHTLSQLFLEILDPEISSDLIHLQVYTYNDLYEQALNKSLPGLFLKLIPRVREHILGRLLIVQGYLHSRHSEPIHMRWMEEPSGSHRWRVEGRRSKDAHRRIRLLLKKLSKYKAELGAVPIAPLLKISPPGQGLHNVGTFPMRQTPSSFESDTMGRLSGYQRVYAVDASVLPSAPASTITLSVMANAHRIGHGAKVENG
jgi:choline dehydrogenase-like flavoprotein